MGRNLTNLPISASFQYLLQVSGSEVTDGLGVDVDSLNLSASFATTASYALNAGVTVDTGSLMVTGSVTSNVLTFEKGDGSTFSLTVDTGSAATVDTGSLLNNATVSDATLTFTRGDGTTFDRTVNNVVSADSASYVAGADVDGQVASAANADTATSASYALTASYAENAGGTIDTGSFYVSSSVVDATITFTQGDGSTEAVTVNNVANATSASLATNAKNAYVNVSAANVDYHVTFNTVNAGYKELLQETEGAQFTYNPSNNKLTVENISATTLSGSLLGNATSATSASYAATASYAENAGSPFPYTGSADITGSLTVDGPAITGDATNTATGLDAASIGGNQNDANGPNSGILGGAENTVNGERSIVVGGYQNLAQDTDTGVFAGFGNQGRGLRGGVFGGLSAYQENYYGAVIAGSSNDSRSSHAGIFVGENGFIQNGCNGAVILGGLNNEIYAPGAYSAILGGSNNLVYGFTGSVVIGGDSIWADAHHTVYVPNLHLTGSTGGTLTFADGTTMTTAAGGGSVDTGSFYYSSSVNLNTITFYQGDGTTETLTVDTGSGGVSIDTGSFYVSSSVVDATITFNQGDGTTESVTVNNVANATSASFASTASFLLGSIESASYASSSTEILITPTNTASYISIPLVDISAISVAGGYANLQWDNQNNLLYKPSTGQLLIATGSTLQVEERAKIGQGYAGQGFEVTGSTSLFGPVDITGSVGILGNTDIVGTLSLPGIADVSASIAAGATFPYTGSADISGSLTLVGPIVTGDDTNNASGTKAVIIGGSLGVASGVRAGIFGGDDNNATGERSAVVGGYQNTAGGTDCAVIGGFGNSASGLRSIAAGGLTNTVNSSYGGSLGGNAANVSHNNSVTLGGSSLSTSKTNEAVANHISYYGQLKGDVDALIISATSASMNCANGNYFTLTLANGVDTHLDATGFSAGQTIKLKVTNNSTSAGTLSYANEFQFAGGTPFAVTAATNAVDILEFVSFDGLTLQATGFSNFS